MTKACYFVNKSPVFRKQKSSLFGEQVPMLFLIDPFNRETIGQ